MYGSNTNEIPYVYSTELFPPVGGGGDGHFPFPQLTNNSTSINFSLLNSAPPPLAIPAVNDYDSLSPLKSEIGYSSSGCSSYSSPTSLASYYGSPSHGGGASSSSSNLIQRSISSHSLQKNFEGFSPMVSSPTGCYMDPETSPVRKVFSTGDLHCMNMQHHHHHQSQRTESSLSNELSIIEGMSKASRYSPEEKKERIERYRSKRNHRNFNKKIKYECRKTLADSRPRIRGRFARNDEIDHKTTTSTSQNQWENHQCPPAGAVEEEEEDDDSLISILNALSANYLIP